MSLTDSGSDADGLRAALHATRVGRHRVVDGKGLEAGTRLLREWQAARLATTHEDLLSDARYGPACRFFLSDIYAPRDFSQRDHDIARVYESMHSVLPAAMRHCLELVIELNELTTDLENRLMDVLADELETGDALTAEQYVNAYRGCDNKAKRIRQLDLIVDVGREVDHLIHLPFVGFALRLARVPARLAGWHDLQDFFERGFAAFKHMHGADEFLERISSRERAILDRIFDGSDRPFELPRPGR